MPSRKRNLEKVERVANSQPNDAPTEERGAAAKYLRDLIGKAERAERGELQNQKPANREEKRSELTWLESEVARIAKIICHRRNDAVQAEATSGADDKLPERIAARLLSKMGLASNKVH